jgi:acetyl-CoA carboxylase biotin carboxyl carrier protein
LMEKHDLSEVSLRNGAQHWRLRRGSQVVTMAAPPPPPPPPPHGPAPVSPPPGATGGDASEAGLLTIKSPTVGTFYPCPAEGEPPFVTVGTKVTPKTVVCLIEAMKVFNQIPADVTGTIAAVLVKQGEAVEFGQPLFKVRP